jgi:ribonuclease J
MAFDSKKHKKELLFIPLGGSGEIGLNMNLYHLDGKWLMVDFGAGFAEDFLPGVDMILPDIQFIEDYKPHIEGLVLTHAHEDHLGAIVYLWEYFDCPIYATPFTAAFLREKITDSRLQKKVKIIEVKPNSDFKVGPFSVELVQITHSVPEMNAVILKTPFGNIFHSGDWKLDHNPMVGEATDQARIKKYGDDGVLAYIGDSTNVFSPGWSGSEGDLRESLIKLIGACPKMVLVTTFASNVARIESIARAAEACGRRVVLAGRSLWRIARAAQSSGYLLDLEHPFLDELNVTDIPREKLLVIATGCQGEPMAATNKIVMGDSS